MPPGTLLRRNGRKSWCSGAGRGAVRSDKADTQQPGGGRYAGIPSLAEKDVLAGAVRAHKPGGALCLSGSAEKSLSSAKRAADGGRDNGSIEVKHFLNMGKP